jgi:hypothetical protein
MGIAKYSRPNRDAQLAGLIRRHRQSHGSVENPIRTRESDDDDHVVSGAAFGLGRNDKEKEGEGTAAIWIPTKSIWATATPTVGSYTVPAFSEESEPVFT